MVVTTAAQFESRFNSVERLFAYWDLPQEAPAYLPGKECVFVVEGWAGVDKVSLKWHQGHACQAGEGEGGVS